MLCTAGPPRQSHLYSVDFGLCAHLLIDLHSKGSFFSGRD